MNKLIIIASIILALGIAVFFFTRPKQSRVDSSSLRLSPSAQNRVTVGGVGLDNVAISNTVDANLYKPRMNEVLVSKISLRQLAYIRRSANQNILVFKDDSELLVTSYVKNQLPSDVLFRLELASENRDSRNHGN